MTQREFSNTDAELSRCIKSRMRHELESLTQYNRGQPTAFAKKYVREYMRELTEEIIAEDF